MHATTYPAEPLALALGEAVTARTLAADDQPRAESLLRDWSARLGWTARQVPYVVRLLSRAPLPAGETRTVPPYPYVHGGPWWLDTSSERQALRGRKSGISRRFKQSVRDAKIRYWRERGRTYRELAVQFGLALSSVHHIVNRTLSAPLPRLRRVRRTLLSMPKRSLFPPPSAIPVPASELSGRRPRLFRALIRWCGLRTVRGLADCEVHREAERLNALESPPLRPGAVSSVVRTVCRYRGQWEPVQTRLRL